MTVLRKRTVSAPKKPAVAAAAQRRTPSKVHVLDIPFSLRGLATLHGARWDAAHGVHVLEAERVPEALAAFVAAPYSWELHVQRLLRGEEAAPASEARGALVLRPHQQKAVDAILAAQRAERAGFLLADDVGLGKTLTAWEAIRRMPGAQRVLVVCPLAVVAHWRRSIEALGDAGRSIVVLNYERLGKLFELSDEARKKVRSKKGLARAGSAPELDVIVWDESHRCKNPTSARSKLAAKLSARAGFCLWLSATAGQNPLELSYLAPLLASVTGAKKKELADFDQWCIEQDLGVRRGAYGRWEWRGDRRDCEKVHAMLFEAPRGGPPAGIRRRPEDIAGWPELNRILAPLELDNEARALYQQAWSEFRRELALAPRGKDPKSALAATLRFRQKSSLLRASSTVELARELLDNGHQVAISVAFVESLQALREELESGLDKHPCALVYGALDAGTRERERLRFQRGEARVVLFTVEEGISLHQGEHNDVARSQIVHDLRWSAIQMAQIEGRCHRDGRFAQVYWSYADGTIEEKITRVVASRLHAMKEMIGDDVETLRAIERVLDGGAD